MRFLAVIGFSVLVLGVALTQGTKPAVAPTEIKWIAGLDDGLKLAKAQKKPLMVDFSAEWCGPCQMMLKKTFRDPEVVKKSASFVNVLIDIDRQQSVARKHGVEAVPTLLFLRSDGTAISRSVGYKEPKELLSLMDIALRAAKQSK